MLLLLMLVLLMLLLLLYLLLSLMLLLLVLHLLDLMLDWLRNRLWHLLLHRLLSLGLWDLQLLPRRLLLLHLLLLLLLLLCLLLLLRLLLLLCRLLGAGRVYMMKLLLLVLVLGLLLNLLRYLVRLVRLMCLMCLVRGMSRLVSLRVLSVGRMVLRLLMVLLLLLLRVMLDLLSLLLLYGLLLLNRLLLLLVVLLLRVPRMTGQCLLRRMLLRVLRVVLRMVLVREDRVVCDGLAHRRREEHGRRVRLGLHLLPRRSGALLSRQGIGDVDVGRARRGIGDACVDRRRRVEEVLRVALRRLLRRIGLRLVWRGRLRRRRLFVGLVRVGGSKAGAASAEGRLGEQAVGIGPGLAQVGHDEASRGRSVASSREKKNIKKINNKKKNQRQARSTARSASGRVVVSRTGRGSTIDRSRRSSVDDPTFWQRSAFGSWILEISTLSFVLVLPVRPSFLSSKPGILVRGCR